MIATPQQQSGVEDINGLILFRAADDAKPMREGLLAAGRADCRIPARQWANRCPYKLISVQVCDVTLMGNKFMPEILKCRPSRLRS
jgi:hypothetical protein